MNRFRTVVELCIEARHARAKSEIERSRILLAAADKLAAELDRAYFVPAGSTTELLECKSQPSIPID